MFEDEVFHVLCHADAPKVPPSQYTPKALAANLRAYQGKAGKRREKGREKGPGSINYS
jgi:hypothetical protein